MTIKDFPREAAYDVMVHWLGEENLLREDWYLAPHPAPDRLGETNPDDVTTRWEWDTDLSIEDSALHDRFVSIALSDKEVEVYDAQQPQIDILKLYRASTPPTTDEQKDTAIRAIIEYLIVDRKEDQ